MADITAMDNAKVWLNTAEVTMNSRIYTTALYSMEMAVEIALKALLMELGINVPKLHNVTNVLKAIFEEKRSALPKEFRDKEALILDTYNDLLEIRPLVGYIFEMNASIDVEEKAKRYIKASNEVVGICGLAIRHISKK